MRIRETAKELATQAKEIPRSINLIIGLLAVVVIGLISLTAIVITRTGGTNAN